MSLGFAEMRERKKGGGKEHIVKTVSEEMLSGPAGVVPLEM